MKITSCNQWLHFSVDIVKLSGLLPPKLLGEKLTCVQKESRFNPNLKPLYAQVFSLLCSQYVLMEGSSEFLL